MSSPSPAQSKSAFLTKLPLEVRCHIYELLFGDKTTSSSLGPRTNCTTVSAVSVAGSTMVYVYRLAKMRNRAGCNAERAARESTGNL
ncbi:hypothetical protein BJY01DRAFT_21209 [Aspergillus pseudoustus]|uniref:F-box domain-containing protein n=1 Tax=Aspergillus pseudoustus TaxID=1810923 RepID=A0ABR4JJT3_9EURO